MKTIINKLMTVIIIAGIFTLFPGKTLMSQNTDFQRFGAVGFSIGTKGYIGTGLIYVDGKYIPKKDFWEYDPMTDSWTQKADLGGTARYFATGFSIGNLGYLGTGVGNGWLKDFWEYNPSRNNWTKKADLGGTGREFAVGLSIGGKGYIGTGYVYSVGKVVNLKDFWEYDPKGNGTWKRKADFIGAPRYAAVGFSINNYGYIGTGNTYNNNDSTYTYYKDFYKYMPGTTQRDSGTWTRINDFGGTARAFAVGFSINNTKGYVGTGIISLDTIYQYTNEFWEFDPAGNTWSRKADFGGTKRDNAVGFSIGTKGYIGTGNLGQMTSLTEDFWEYNQLTNVWTRKADFGSKHNGPLKDATTIGETDPLSDAKLIVYPNPSNSTFNFRLQTMSEELVTIQIFDMLGRLVNEYKSLSPDNVMTVKDILNVGVYIAVVTQGEYRKTIKLSKVN